jgi:hypothetical protein
MFQGNQPNGGFRKLGWGWGESLHPLGRIAPPTGAICPSNRRVTQARGSSPAVLEAMVVNRGKPRRFPWSITGITRPRGRFPGHLAVARAELGGWRPVGGEPRPRGRPGSAGRPADAVARASRSTPSPRFACSPRSTSSISCTVRQTPR